MVRALITLFVALTATGARAVDVGDPMPAVQSGRWLNSAPLDDTALKDKVVLVEFWTYRCRNCRNVEPQVKQWFGRYRNEGLVVLGVHTPEFDHEKKPENVAAYLREHAIAHPVAIDNDYANWNRFENRYWPAFYLRDRRGLIRYVHFGEGQYGETDAMIRALLAENH
ncbi:MAG: Thiol-disulfide oxidoreductase YkuV [Chromatiales bacterium USCg_Taylor]|nr:MAG: Thiol-disulfide oxidoreductase YkuV [Chromatiales bacterium USCg_Taylor]